MVLNLDKYIIIKVEKFRSATYFGHDLIPLKYKALLLKLSIKRKKGEPPKMGK